MRPVHVPRASPDELRRILHVASTLLASIGSTADAMSRLRRVRQSVVTVLAGVDALMTAAELEEPLTPSLDPSNIEPEP